MLQAHNGGWVGGGRGSLPQDACEPPTQQLLATASVQAGKDALLTPNFAPYCWGKSNLCPLINSTEPSKNHF